MNLLSNANHRLILISVAAMAFFVVLTHFSILPQVISIRHIASITFLILVMYAAFKHGFISGLLIAVVAELFFLFTYSIPGQLFYYSIEDTWRLATIGFTLIALSYLIGSMKQHFSNHIVAEKNAREIAEKTAHNLKKNVIKKEEFISIASHELKTPITSLRLFTHLLKKKAEDEKDSQTALYIKKIDNQVNNLLMLTSNLLDASRITKGKLTLRQESFPINKLVNEKIDEIAAIYDTRKIIKKGSTTRNILGDKNYISQVLINLLNNAVRYSPDSDKIIVQVEEKNKAIDIHVQDFGPGIAKEHQKKIFKQFYQIGGRKANRGLGIGLYISSQIVKQHGGKISVKSNQGKGSTFTISLPLE